jgi:flagellar biosynthesis protein FliP
VIVTVVDAGKVRMRVNQHVMVVRVLMRLRAVPVERMLVLMMSAVNMRVIVVLRFMRVALSGSAPVA